MVHLDAQCLEHPGGIFLLVFPLEQVLGDMQQVVCGCNGLRRPGLHDGCCYSPGALQFPVEVEDVGQLLFIGLVHDLRCRGSPFCVHSHIQCGIEAERESACLIIEMMARYPKVGQQTVYLLHAVIAHPVAQVAEITSNEGEPLITWYIPFCVCILVKTVQMTVLAQSLQYLFAVPATPKRHIHIDAVGTDC